MSGWMEDVANWVVVAIGFERSFFRNSLLFGRSVTQIGVEVVVMPKARGTAPIDYIQGGG